MKYTTKPLHEHDCDKCVYLGTEQGNDLYYCDREPTVIARYGEYGEYASGLCFADRIPLLGMARDRAIEAGLITPENAVKWAQGRY